MQARVVVVNDIPGHFEVLAGVLHVLKLLHVRPDVLYTGNPSMPLSWGLLPWLGEQPSASRAVQGAGGQETGIQVDRHPKSWCLIILLLCIGHDSSKQRTPFPPPLPPCMTAVPCPPTE